LLVVYTECMLSGMSTPVLADGTEVRTSPITARPLLLGAMASLSAGAAAIHFAVMFEHFSEYSLYGVFFLVLAWAQLVWPVVLIALPFLTWAPAKARPARFPAGWSRSGLTPPAARRMAAWLWLGIAGNAGVVVIYFCSRSIGLPFGPDTKTTEGWGGLDLVCAIEEILLVVLAAAVLARPGLLARPVRLRGQPRSLAAVLAAPVVVIAATAAVMTPAWAGSEGPSGMASGASASSGMASGASGSSSSMANSSGSLQGGMGDMGSTDGLPDMQMYGSTNPPTAAQVQAAAILIKQTDASLVRFENVNNAIAAGYTERLATNGEEHLLCQNCSNAYQGLNPQDPSSLVYAINVKGHPPILLGAMYLMGNGNGPQVGGGLTRWHSHLEVCQNGRIIIAGFGVALPGSCNPSTWKDQYTTQMLHVWVVPYPGGVFSDDLSTAATTAAAQAALAQTKPGHLAP
jgi:hypothetical protein